MQLKWGKRSLMNKVFAPEYNIDENGLYHFPRDDKYRKQLFPFLDLSSHPAKANIYMTQAIIEYVSEPGETVMDIMSGTGTIMTAALIGRRVVCLEIEEHYQWVLEQALLSLGQIDSSIPDMITIIGGDCYKLLPLPIADHVIFSPPYANIMRKKSLDKLSAEMVGTGLLDYSQEPDNIGNLNEFMYHQKMEKVYKKVFQSLPTDGTLSIIIKDHIEQGERMMLGERAERDCVRAGFSKMNWFKWLPPGSAYSSFMRARGDIVVDDEDIVILRKEHE